MCSDDEFLSLDSKCVSNTKMAIWSARTHLMMSSNSIAYELILFSVALSFFVRYFQDKCLTHFNWMRKCLWFYPIMLSNGENKRKIMCMHIKWICFHDFSMKFFCFKFNVSIAMKCKWDAPRFIIKWCHCTVYTNAFASDAAHSDDFIANQIASTFKGIQFERKLPWLWWILCYF